MLGIKKIKPNKKRALLVMFLSLAVLFLLGGQVLAQVNAGLTPEFGAQAGLGTTDIRLTIARIIRAILGFLGVLALIIILYGGFVYMTSGGNEEKIAKAKKILVNAVIGLLIILASFGLTQFIIGRIMAATGIQPGGAGVGGPGGSALGAGPIESVYPPPNATGIPRNTNIIITFKNRIVVSSIIDSNGNITDKLKICKLDDCPQGIYLPNTGVQASVTDDHRTFLFHPVDLLGSPDQPTWYKVIVDGSIQKDPTGTLFQGEYDWKFQVSTVVDLTPPQVSSVIPFPASTNPRNTIVQINFNKGVNPITASGQVQVDANGQPTATSFKNLLVQYQSGGTNQTIAGNFVISNQYKTVEFIANQVCTDAQGNALKNSCGGNVYCLPGNQNLTVLIKAASLSSQAPTATNPPDGVADLANNSLDGNKDGKAEGPVSNYDLGAPDATKGDNVVWTFATNNNIDLTPPKILSVTPVVGAGTTITNTNTAIPPASPSRPIMILFSKLIMSSTLKPDSNYTDSQGNPDPYDYVTLNQPAPPSPLPTGYTDAASWEAANWVGYWLGKIDGDLSNNGTLESAGIINHGQFLQFSGYNTNVGSGVKDINQNCFYPSAGPNCPAPQGTQASPTCQAVP